MYNFSSPIDDGKCDPATAGIAELNHVWNNFYETQKSLTNDGNPLTTPLVRYIYWSSSEWHYDYDAWFFTFEYGVADHVSKEAVTNVRAIRAF